MRKCMIIRDIVIQQCFHEFDIESNGTEETLEKGILAIPALVSAFFLQYICHNKLCDYNERDRTLYELSISIQYDEGHHIREYDLPLSWQVLGICQQISGDDQAACRSFVKALRKKRHCCKKATLIRLGIIFVKYFSPRN